MLKLVELIALTLLISTPFGYWRFKTRKYSLAWFLSIHIPVPALYLIRRVMGLSLYYLPVITIFFILGHVLGARLHKSLGVRQGSGTSACLFLDTLRLLPRKAAGKKTRR